jgi:hypothetical protein
MSYRPEFYGQQLPLRNISEQYVDRQQFLPSTFVFEQFAPHQDPKEQDHDLKR